MIIKLAVLNNSGNVGKSTVCQTLLKPRINESELIRVETINDDGMSDGEALSAKDMVSIIEKIDMADNAIIDVGSSNIEAFIKGLQKQTGAQEDIDLFLIPTTPNVKQQKDTITTIETLIDMDVDPNDIRLVLNKIDEEQSIAKQFSTLINGGVLKLLESESLNEFVTIEETDIFTLLEKIESSYFDVLNDSTDYKKEIRATDCKTTRSNLSFKRSTHRLVKSFNQKLDIEFLKLGL